jgi:superfamily II DNA or RNA helicase
VAASLSDKLRVTTELQFVVDWERQRRTAADILLRLQSQEGVILADQVGMGKTYVALAVAVSEILSTHEFGRVVVFVPPSVADKWVREWKKFRETLVEHGSGIRCVEHPIRSGEDFLKALDDPPERRNHLVIVTYTALTSSLKDNFIQLALLYYATKGVHGAAALRQRIAKWSDGRRGIIPNTKFTPDAVAGLLRTPPVKWREEWLKLKNEELPDDPVPTSLEEAARSMSFGALRNIIEGLPIRSSADIANRLQRARMALTDITQTVWKSLLSSTALDLPLLIVDEAHRLKNSDTQISKLFAPRSDDPKSGAFHGVFRRMLFLTATPFELGHNELINVLSRMGAVSRLVRPPLDVRLDALQRVLTAAQASALSFDEAWGRLTQADLSAFDTWEPGAAVPDLLSAAAREAWMHASLAVQARRKMHDKLKGWVIRHERPHRRDYLAGAAIVGNKTTEGLIIPDEAALPFLLAARAQSVALDEKGPVRPLFAYGIASSYEAFGRLGFGADADGRDSDVAKEDRDGCDPSSLDHWADGDAVRWYRQEIDSALKNITVREAHPKVSATVEKAASLWLQGEKCLVFSWFIRSGKAIEDALSKRIDALITKAAENALHDANPAPALYRISERLFRSDSSSYARTRERLSDALKGSAGGYDDVLDLVVDAGIRHLRTPGYLVRYTSLRPDINDAQVWAGIQGENPNNIALLERWKLFAERLAKARRQIEAIDATDERDSEFARVRAALLGIHMEDDSAYGRGASLQPVRRAYGGAERRVRERLIALFNTPFAPELLVASSVMGEGIDLHQECRFVIHHDLDWNPSVLEQRTGRLDRIGALAERLGKNIEVYEPYLAGTHDEKMYKVVKDRAQWFDIVMGRSSNSDDHVTDVEATRVPLHQKIKDALTMDLRSLELRL